MTGVIGRPLAMLFCSSSSVGASTGQHKGGMDGWLYTAPDNLEVETYKRIELK